ncbi:HD domain-containing protein [Roseibium aggregatum]|uniref:HD domain-containing protein n=1 Tax=Roseibium aggregatum TaxID=187304 RepID=UPI00111513CB|nr:HD domain-containing protein [Roseibium aggregatum]UFI04908.1 HD domain-containing protein [Roseibium aggregatum]
MLNVETPNYALRSDDRNQLFDPIANELLSTRSMQRLAHIGFLGAIDHFRRGNGKEPHRRKHNRLEHSVGVALLAQRFALSAEISQMDRLKLLAASLLHDIGHGPLSHTLEPVFEEALGIDHHRATRSIVLGNSILGTEILDILKRHQLDPEEIMDLIDSRYDGSFGYLFSGKINLDTLEGITRCRAIVGRRPAFGTALSVVERWAQSGQSKLPKADFDEFWKLKHNVYALLINSPTGLVMDTVAQAWARTNLAQLDTLDFFMDERQLRKKYPELFLLINLAASDRGSLITRLPAKWLNAEVQARRRRYYVDESVDLISLTDMTLRYKHKKNSWTVSLGELLGGV